jgi:hypothetical protein
VVPAHAIQRADARVDAQPAVQRRLLHRLGNAARRVERGAGGAVGHELQRLEQAAAAYAADRAVVAEPLHQQAFQMTALPDVSRKTVAEVTDGLVPALQRRGLVRRNYSHAHFRNNTSRCLL